MLRQWPIVLVLLVCSLSTFLYFLVPGAAPESTAGLPLSLVKDDPLQAVQQGYQVLQRQFVKPATSPQKPIKEYGEPRVTQAAQVSSCIACHQQPGYLLNVSSQEPVQTAGAMSLYGLGIIEQLADEMTAELRIIRDHVVTQARASGSRITLPLLAKRVSFGHISAEPNGQVDLSGVEGVEADLRIRPFSYHSQVSSIRELIVAAFSDAMGVEVFDPLLCAATDPVSPVPVQTPAGFRYDAAQDQLARPSLCESRMDKPDITAVDKAMIDNTEFYLLNFFIQSLQHDAEQERLGRKLLQGLGCSHCHMPDMVVERDRRVIDMVASDIQPDASGVIDLQQSEISRKHRSIVRNIFTDLKRHDLGQVLGVRRTTPFWVGGDSLQAIDAGIRQHAGTALSSRQRYEKLSIAERQTLLDFLLSLRQPVTQAQQLKQVVSHEVELD